MLLKPKGATVELPPSQPQCCAAGPQSLFDRLGVFPADTTVTSSGRLG